MWLTGKWIDSSMGMMWGKYAWPPDGAIDGVEDGKSDGPIDGSLDGKRLAHLMELQMEL